SKPSGCRSSGNSRSLRPESPPARSRLLNSAASPVSYRQAMNSQASQATHDAAELPIPLRDGSEVLIRPVRPADKALVAGAYERLSPESRRRRFLAAPSHLTAEDLRYFTEIDHRRHEAVIALDAESGEMVGDARYVRLPGDREVGEVATFVDDEWQRRGLAT